MDAEEICKTPEYCAEHMALRFIYHCEQQRQAKKCPKPLMWV